MARRTFVYREDENGRFRAIETTPETYHYSDNERLMIEGTQGERVLRGYKEIEDRGRLREQRLERSARQIKRAWSDEVTGRFE